MKLRKFIRGEKFYFQMLNDDGAIIIESQAYQSKDARANGIKSVKENISNKERYEQQTNDGKFSFVLKAGNNQEIGRSVREFDNEKDMLATMNYALSSRASSDKKEAAPAPVSDSSDNAPAKEAQPDGGEAYPTDGKNDDYKPLRFYESNGNKVASGFDSFDAEGESYFSYCLDGKIYLISEGYKSAAARDNGISSVQKNLNIEGRYQRQVHSNGKHYFNLRAGNNQEIATSRWFDDLAQMNGIIERLIATQSGGGALGVASGDGDGTLVAANRIASVSVDAPPPAAVEQKPKKKRKKRATSKPKAEKVYLSEGEYHFNNINYQLFRSSNHKHYFTFKNSEGKTILLNSDVRGFETQEQGQLTIDQVLKYAPSEANYEGKMTKNDKYYFYLKGDEGKNIAKSFFFKTEEEMQVTIGSLLGDVLATDTITKPTGAAPEASQAKSVEDDYLPCAVYQAHARDKTEGHEDFISFEHEGGYYFAWINAGNITMRSEKYTTATARDNGIASVIKNRDTEERYSIVEKGGFFFAVLKAGNHQEIARSCPHLDEAAARFGFPSELAKTRSLFATSIDQTDTVETSADTAKSERKDDDYLSCKSYEAHLNDKSAKYEDFITFEEAGSHFFAWVDKKKIVMRSERYTTPKARDNGMESVIKNRENDKRFSIEEKLGFFFAVLKAGNYQEIARSCPYKTRVAAMYYFPSEIEKRAAKIAKLAKDAEEEKKMAAAKKKEEQAAATALVMKAAKKDDDYLHCKYYKGHERSDKYPDFSLFKKDDEFYFAMLDKSDEVVLRSEGYKSARGRENGIKSVIKNREIEGRYSTDQKDGMYYAVLKAGNNQEIGRSCPYKEESKALGFLAPMAAVTAAFIPGSKSKAAVDKEDDYLNCKEYENREVNDKINNVALFKHDHDGQYYFALYDENGDVMIRSEGFGNAKSRDEELSGVLRYHDDKDMYKRKEKGAYYMDILYDKSGREIGRSCLKKRAAAFAAVPAAAAAAAAAIVIPPATPKPVGPPPKKGGGFKWWWLLPLLLIPLLWFLLRGCGGTEPPVTPPVTPPPPPTVIADPPPVVDPPPVTPPPATPPVVDPPPVTPPSGGCACSHKGIDIFNIPEYDSPRVITRLGTNPEFGSGQNLSPTQFWQKLSDAYSNNEIDRQYLDYLSRAMGYRSGFSDVTASRFSSVTLPEGSKGILGFGAFHGYAYSQINTSEKDRQAFKMAAQNGCDVHFMKTCGNYMFVCE